MIRTFILGALLAVPATTPAAADPAEIVAAEARAVSGGLSVSVTLRHGDTGWDDYADGWRIITDEGEVLGTRTLFHPHVDEQPFTRSLTVDELPDGPLFIESSTNVTGWSGTRFPFDPTGE